MLLLFLMKQYFNHQLVLQLQQILLQLLQHCQIKKMRRKNKNILHDIAGFKITGLNEQYNINEEEVGSSDDNFALFGDDEMRMFIYD